MTNHLHWVWWSNQTDVAKYFHFQNIFPLFPIRLSSQQKNIFLLQIFSSTPNKQPLALSLMEQPDWFCDQETALEERRGNENAKLVSAYFLWHCCGGSERLGGNDKLGLRRYTLDCPPPLTSCLPLSFPALSLSLSWKVEGLQLRWKGARLQNRIGKEAVPCKSGGEHGQHDG